MPGVDSIRQNYDCVFCKEKASIKIGKKGLCSECKDKLTDAIFEGVKDKLARNSDIVDAPCQS